MVIASQFHVLFNVFIVFAKWAGPYQEMFTVNHVKRRITH